MLAGATASGVRESKANTNQDRTTFQETGGKITLRLTATISEIALDYTLCKGRKEA